MRRVRSSAAGHRALLQTALSGRTRRVQNLSETQAAAQGPISRRFLRKKSVSIPQLSRPGILRASRCSSPVDPGRSRPRLRSQPGAPRLSWREAPAEQHLSSQPCQKHSPVSTTETGLLFCFVLLRFKSGWRGFLSPGANPGRSESSFQIPAPHSCEADPAELSGSPRPDRRP